MVSDPPGQFKGSPNAIGFVSHHQHGIGMVEYWNSGISPRAAPWPPIGFVLHDCPSALRGLGVPSASSGQALARHLPESQLGSFCIFRSSRSGPAQAGPDWVRFAHSPRVPRPWGLVPPGRAGKLGSFCTLCSPGNADLPIGIVAGIGFVLHDWPAQGRGGRSQGAFRRKSVPNPQSEIRNREIGFVSHASPSWERQSPERHSDRNWVRFARPAPDWKAEAMEYWNGGVPWPPEIGFVLRISVSATPADQVNWVRFTSFARWRAAKAGLNWVRFACFALPGTPIS